jgi:hypothetical protein
MSQTYCFPEADCRQALRDCTKADVEVLLCSCGCDSPVLWARDVRALWIVSSRSADPSLRVLGLETQKEFDRYRGRMVSIGWEPGWLVRLDNAWRRGLS